MAKTVKQKIRGKVRNATFCNLSYIRYSIFVKIYHLVSNSNVIEYYNNPSFSIIEWMPYLNLLSHWDNEWVLACFVIFVIYFLENLFHNTWVSTTWEFNELNLYFWWYDKKFPNSIAGCMLAG